MKLMQASQPIVYTKYNQNYFILDLATPNKTMQVIGYK